jgi:flavin-dependent dehydrogenase
MSVLVVEADRFPRHHIGESLVRLWTVFDALGVLDQMEQTFQHKYGSGRIWGESRAPKWTFFDEQDPRPYSLHVRRSQFDAMLADRAGAAGANIRFGWRAVEPIRENERISGIRARDENGVIHDLRARFVIDASGRAGFLPKRLKLRVLDPFYPDLSVFTYVTGALRFPGTQAGGLFIESVPLGWLWFIPLREGDVSVGLVCDQDSRSELRRRGLSDFLGSAVHSSTGIAKLLTQATAIRPTAVVASGGYSSTRYGGPGWLLAGDAGQFVDPMWATGVANSLRDGIRAASAVHGLISGTVTEDEAVAFHDGHSARQATTLHETVRYVYGLNLLHSNAAFWRNRHSQLPAPAETFKERGLGWLAKDPNVAYFRSAFASMGVQASAVAELDKRLNDLMARGDEATRLAKRPLDEWTPRWGPRWEPRPAVGMDMAGIVRRGVEVGHGDDRMFSADPVTIAALGLVDGSRSVGAILRALTARTGRPVDALGRAQALAALKTAHSEGAIVSLGQPGSVR